jgi:uncharacterized protein
VTLTAEPTAARHLATLRWLLLSPPLVIPPPLVVSPNADAPLAEFALAVFTPHESAEIDEWLCALELDTTADNPLSVWMHSRTEARIGRYAERLLEFYLTHGPVHRLAAAHVPLRSEVNGLKVTHGELDFLLTTSQGLRLHWELAVKFFLCSATGPVATPADFIGPNGVETLAHKWHKLFAKQLQRQTTHALPAPWNAHPWQPQAYTRGWMFYRWGQAVPQCDALHAQHGKGWWIDWAGMAQLPQGQYVHLSRLQWMAPVDSAMQLGSDTTIFTRHQIAAHLAQHWAAGTQRATDAQMLVLLPSASDHLSHRFFIRPN